MNTIAHEYRKARKPHVCMLCGREIGVGETYLHQRNVDCGDIWTWRSCQHCNVLTSVLYRINCGFDEGIDSYGVADWEPETIAQARLKVCWKRRWHKRDGTLRPIAEIVAVAS